jgi:glycosyltransferase involved in cell wall biosynthesis
MCNPKITVLMSVYNGEKYLCEAVDSILKQTFKDFEFLIINDGSTDKTEEILKSYGDSRIKVYNNKENIGLSKSLNIGLKMAKGEYVARQDADDISMPDRLNRQADFLNTHPDYAVVGTFARILNENSEEIRLFRRPTEDIDIRKSLRTDNCLVHGSVMIRMSFLLDVGFYNEAMERSQDYELWLRLAKKYYMKNIADFLYCRRMKNKNLKTNYILGQQTFVAFAKVKNNTSDIKEAEEHLLDTIARRYFVSSKTKTIFEWIDKLTFNRIRSYRILRMGYKIRFASSIRKILSDVKSETIDFKKAKSKIARIVYAGLLDFLI